MAYDSLAMKPRILLILFGSLIAAGVASAAEPATITRDDLTRGEVRIVSISDGRVHFFGHDHKLVSIDADSLVRIEFPGRDPSQRPWVPSIELADGQRITGRLGDDFANPLALPWVSEHLGAQTLALDDVASIRFQPASSSDGNASPESDSVLLANDDRVEGFVDRVNAEGLALDRDGATVQLPWSGIRSLTLANPREPAPGVWVELADLSTLLADELEVRGSTLRARSLGVEWSTPLDQVLRIRFNRRHNPVPLGDLPYSIESGGSAFGVQYPPELRSTHAKLHAPISLRFTLPRGATRFAVDATVALDPPGEAVGNNPTHADLIFVVADDTGELFRQRLDKEFPTVRVNVPVSGTLRLTLDDSEGGPVQDWLLLDDAEVLVSRDSP